MKGRHRTELEFARQARRSVLVIRQRLVNPTPKVLESCGPHLRVAIEALDGLQDFLVHPDSQTLRDKKTIHEEVSQLGRELAQVKALLEQAAAYHLALSRLLIPVDDSIAYAARGVIAMRPAPTMFVQG